MALILAFDPQLCAGTRRWVQILSILNVEVHSTKTNAKRKRIEMKRRLPCLAILSFLLAVCGAAKVAHAGSDTLEKIKSSKRISIGYREASVPFSYLGDQQRPVGFSVDLCVAISERIKAVLKLDALDIAYTSVNASNRIPLLQNGTIDIECGSTTNTVERQKQVGFSFTTFVSQPRFMVTSASGIVDPRDLRGKTVVITQGSGALAIAQKHPSEDLAGLTVTNAKDHAESLFTLRTGRAAGWLEEDVVLAGTRALASDAGNFVILPKAYATFNDALMIRKDDADFKSIVDETIAAMMKSGEFARLYNKWFNSPIQPAGHVLNLPISAALKSVIDAPNDRPTP
ncbi:transporter substrate-binding domain-containing protein [Bradyrhizobium liaoningense]|uniref:transporter substrate-binding domain-containing protein n=1 Tax=Bradyrhizobium liaoningense TaxID=43992 RepID=UPI002012A766|nr:transporter substrate-binding domain-containing protein [Bradyrhizobium liaoningense]